MWGGGVQLLFKFLTGTKITDVWHLEYGESVAVFSNRFAVFKLSTPASIIGGANIHIFVFTNLNENIFQKKLMMQNTIYEYSPLQLSKLHGYATGNHVKRESDFSTLMLKG